MSNIDNELFELFDEVSTATGWVEKTQFDEHGLLRMVFTSDYLLDKLQPYGTIYITLGKWATAQFKDKYETGFKGDTTLKALLRLAKVLAKAGELKV